MNPRANAARLTAALLACGALASACSSANSTGPEVGPLLTEAQMAPFTVQTSDLGIHSNSVKPSAAVGALRMNCFPTWRQVNPSEGAFDWEYMDAMVDRARKWGYVDVVHSFCATPEWAAGASTNPDRDVYGPKSAAPPRDLAFYETYVTEVVKRYKGRITAYQAWNEPTTDQFFQGTPEQMAEMTVMLNRAVEEHDPAALVVGASLQRFNDDVSDWGRRYLELLKQADWPVDVLSFHGYSEADTFTEGRQKVIADFRSDLVALEAPDLPLWDTEVTYKASKKLGGERAGSLVIRSYLDGWRMGIERTYWYAWTDDFNPFGAIQMREGYPAAAALERFSREVIGASYEGCEESPEGVVRCSFSRDGAPFTIAWAEGKARRVTLPQAAEYQNLASGEEGSGATLRVTGSPLLIRGVA